MKKIIGVSAFFVLLIVGYTVYSMSQSGQEINRSVASNVMDPIEIVKEEIEIPSTRKKKGDLTIVTSDKTSSFPIKETKYSIYRVDENEKVAEVLTDLSGKAMVKSLPYGRYSIRQEEIISPYHLENHEQTVELDKERLEVAFTNTLPDIIQKFKRTENGDIAISQLYIPVNEVLQLPELPNGCEITSLTAVLNFYGYDVTKTNMADNYLEKVPFTRKNNKRYSANPYKAYAGDPRSLNGGFFCYAPPLMDAANKFVAEKGGNEKPIDISGSTREEIIEYLNRGIPVMIWVTLDLSKPKVNYSWHFHDTGELFNAPINLHAVVLNGYDEENVHVMNPLIGQLTYNADSFFRSYGELGEHAMILLREKEE